jgi:hypothetical protein
MNELKPVVITETNVDDECIRKVRAERSAGIFEAAERNRAITPNGQKALQHCENEGIIVDDHDLSHVRAGGI